MSWRDYASAPDEGNPVCARDDVQGAVALTIETAKGRFPVILVEMAAGVRAYVNACPHQYLPLDYRGGQILSADGTRLMCTSHGAQFDVATGMGVAGEGLGCALDAVPLTEEAGRLFVGAGS